MIIRKIPDNTSHGTKLYVNSPAGREARRLPRFAPIWGFCQIKNPYAEENPLGTAAPFADIQLRQYRIILSA